MTQPLREQLQATLGRAYTLERELGGGGMSRVFLAEETALRRQVVVKVLPAELTAGVNVERFNREILVAARLQHPHIVPVLTAGEMAGLPYYTMPFVEGESLRARLGREGALPIGDAVGILRDVAKALAYAHDHGIVHRDIKPDNVLLAGGSATVTDFGIAKAISASRTAGSGATLTQTGTSLGTPAYMAPEQAAGDPGADHRADLYSFGCLAYELLAGEPPFTEPSPQKLLAAHLTATPRAITELRPDVPPALAELVMRCLAKEAGDRPQRAADLLPTLDAVTASGSSAALVGAPGMFRKALALYAVAFLAVALLARAAITGIGLPDWVFPGALIVMALGLPAVLWTGYAQHVARQAALATPTYTPGGTQRAAVHGPVATLALKAAPHMRWRRTTRAMAVAVAAFVVAVALFMAMRAFGIGPAATLLSRGELTAGAPIILTDFSGDTSLTRAVSRGVRIGLTDSPVLTVVGEAEVAAALERMQRPRTARVDLELARELAAREGAAAIIDGEITPVGSDYILTVRLLTADAGRDLDLVQALGKGTDGLIDAADKVARQLRARAGESLRSVQRLPMLSRVTTGSLEALRKYSEGMRVVSMEVDYRKAVPLLREAVAIDSQFAEAWRLLGVALTNRGPSRAQSDSALRKAFELRERLPEWERLRVVGSYYAHDGPGRDRAKSLAAWEAIGHLTNMGSILAQRREFAKCESIYRTLIARPNPPQTAYLNVNIHLVAQGKLASADSMVWAGLEKFPASQRLRERLIWLQYSRGALDSVELALDSARKVPGPNRTDPGYAPRTTAAVRLLRGRLADWRRYRGFAVGPDTVYPGHAATVLGVAALVGGRVSDELKVLEAALTQRPLRALHESDRPYLWVAQQFAWAGHPDRARAILAERRAEVRDTALLRYQQPDLHTTLGVIALAERKFQEALMEFRRGDMAPDGPANTCNICLPLYLALTFDAAGMADSAITRFEAFINTPSIDHFLASQLDPTFLPLSHERLGQLYEAKGDTANAVKHHRKFIDLWKDADAVLQPRVKAARDRLYKLAPVERRGG